MKQTKLHDMLGNTIQSGSLLFWTSLKAPVKVVRIEPLLSDEGADPKRPQGKIIVEMGLTFDASREEYFLNDFVKVVDPVAQKQIENIVKSKLHAVDSPRREPENAQSQYAEEAPPVDARCEQ